MGRGSDGIPPDIMFKREMMEDGDFYISNETNSPVIDGLKSRIAELEALIVKKDEAFIQILAIGDDSRCMECTDTAVCADIALDALALTTKKED